MTIVHLRLRATTISFVTPANKFDIVQEYLRQPIPIHTTEDQPSWPSSPSLTTVRDITDIIKPYPNITTFLYNFTWQRMKGVSASGRASFTKVLLDERFKTQDLASVDFAAIEKELASDNQSPWGGNGWRRSTILVEVPTGKKSTAASRSTAANARSRNQRHNEVDPDADPFPVYKVPIHDVRT